MHAWWPQRSAAKAPEPSFSSSFPRKREPRDFILLPWAPAWGATSEELVQLDYRLFRGNDGYEHEAARFFDSVTSSRPRTTNAIPQIRCVHTLAHSREGKVGASRAREKSVELVTGIQASSPQNEIAGPGARAGARPTRQPAGEFRCPCRRRRAIPSHLRIRIRFGHQRADFAVYRRGRLRLGGVNSPASRRSIPKSSHHPGPLPKPPL